MNRRLSLVAGTLGALALAFGIFALASGMRTRPAAAGGCCSTHGGSDGLLADYAGIAVLPDRRADLERLEREYRDSCGRLCRDIDAWLDRPAGAVRERQLAALQRERTSVRDGHRAAVLQRLSEAADRDRYLKNVASSAHACRLES